MIYNASIEEWEKLLNSCYKNSTSNLLYIIDQLEINISPILKELNISKDILKRSKSKRINKKILDYCLNYIKITNI